MIHQGLQKTDFHLPGQIGRYQGKVRDVYFLEKGTLVMVATDRISAFDVILPRCIPGKGAILNQIAAEMLFNVKDIVPIWLQEVPAPGVSIGFACESVKLEVVVRGYLAGHAARQYALGHRSISGVPLPEGLRENERLPDPIITPTTKATEGHDEDISMEEAVAVGLVSEKEAVQLQAIAMKLFERGSEIAAERGLILVDTKYEFGRSSNGALMLIDEIHTPDSSRYFELSDYQARMKLGERPRQLSKEFVREWLISEGFQGQNGQVVPEMTDAKVLEIQGRYSELFSRLTGKVFQVPKLADYLELEEKVRFALS